MCDLPWYKFATLWPVPGCFPPKTSVPLVWVFSFFFSLFCCARNQSRALFVLWKCSVTDLPASSLSTNFIFSLGSVRAGEHQLLPSAGSSLSFIMRLATWDVQQSPAASSMPACSLYVFWHLDSTVLASGCSVLLKTPRAISLSLCCVWLQARINYSLSVPYAFLQYWQH